jgi:hypothetical protein
MKRWNVFFERKIVEAVGPDYHKAQTRVEERRFFCESPVTYGLSLSEVGSNTLH